MQVIGEDEEELGGYVTTEEFLRLRDTSTCGKMQARIASCALRRQVCWDVLSVRLRDTSTCGKMQVCRLCTA